MSDITLDQISIQVEGNSDKAIESLNKLVETIDNLTKSTSKGFFGLEKTNKKIQEITNTAKKNTQKLNTDVKKNIGGIVKEMAKIGIAAMGIGESIKQAVEYTASISQFNSTLNTNKEILEDATDFVYKLTDAWYLNEQEVMSTMSRYYSMTNTMGIASKDALRMSKNLTMLTQDLAAWKQVDTSEVMNQIASGLRGEAEGLSKFGISLNQATLQSVLYANGIDRTVSSLNAAQKAELIYYQIMKQTQSRQGYFTKTLLEPANVLRTTKTLFINLARAIGSVFIPILQAAAPYIMLITNLLNKLARALASLLGFELGDWGDSTEQISSGISDIGDSAESTSKKVKGMLADFDELHTIDFGDAGGSGDNLGAGGSLGLDASQFEYDMDLLNIADEKIQAIKDKLYSIGSLLIGLTLGKFITDILKASGLINSLQAAVISLGFALVGLGVSLVFQGLTQDDIKKQILGALSVGAGVGLIVAGMTKSKVKGLKASLFVTIATLEIEVLFNIVKWWNKYFETEKQKLYGEKKELNLGEFINVSFTAIGEGATRSILSLFGLEDEEKQNQAIDNMINKISDFQKAYGLLETQINNFKTNWDAFWINIPVKVEEAKINISDKFQEMKDNIGNRIDETKTNVSSGFEIIKTDMSNKINDAKTKLSDKFQEIKTNTVNKIEETRTNISNKFQEIKDNISNKITEAKDTVSNIFEEIKNTISDKIENAKTTIKNGIEAIKGFFKFEWSLPEIKTPHISWETEPASGWIADILSAVGLPTSIPKMKIDWYEDGGFPKSGDLFWSNENGKPEWVGTMNGRTAVANNDQITTGVRQAAYEGMSQALAEYSGGGTVIYNYLDSKEIASKMTRVKKSNDNMYG